MQQLPFKYYAYGALVIAVLFGIRWGVRYVYVATHEPIASETSEQGVVETEIPETGAEPAQRFETYTDVAGVYTIRYPLGWTVKAASDAVAFVDESKAGQSDAAGYPTTPHIEISVYDDVTKLGYTNVQAWQDARYAGTTPEILGVKEVEFLKVNAQGPGEKSYALYQVALSNISALTISVFPAEDVALVDMFEREILPTFILPTLSHQPTSSAQPTSVVIGKDFGTRLTYGDGTQEDQQRDCAQRGGTFNACGSACESEQEICILVCVPSCENISRQ